MYNYSLENKVTLKKHMNKKKPAAQAAGQTLPDATPPPGKISRLPKSP